MGWKRKLFESYNEAIAAGYDLYAEERGKEAAEGLESGVYEEYRHEAESRWKDTPLDTVDGKTPVEILRDTVDLSDTVELYKEACILCDDGIPAILEEKLKSFGNAAEDRLLELACNRPVSEQDEAFMITVISVRLLGEWKVTRLAPTLVRLLLECSPEDFMLMEELESALVNTGDTDILLEGMVSAERWSHPHEYLASALAKAGKHRRKDSVYRCLKEYFLKYEKTMLGASNLAEYGDSRAIPALRGYAERHMAMLDIETFYEIKSAVERLGGNMDDLDAEYGRIRRKR